MAIDGIRWKWDTIPHLLTATLGSILMFMHSIPMGIFYLIVTIIGMFWFWGFICTRCMAYGHPSCPSGYGMISSRFFKRKDGDFGKAFKRNIFSVTLQWFIPLGVGIYDIIFDTGPIRIALLIVFILVAFVYLPLAARKKGCDSCPQKGDCPWKR